MSKLIYLSGACKHLEDEGISWRNKALEACEWFNDLKCFSPNQWFNYSSNVPDTDRQCMDYFLHQVRKSNVVLVNLDHTNKSVGTGMEVMLANELRIPIVGFTTGEEVYPWIREMCTVVLDTVENAIEYINAYYGE